MIGRRINVETVAALLAKTPVGQNLEPEGALCPLATFTDAVRFRRLVVSVV